jgi:hypothetical protein
MCWKPPQVPKHGKRFSLAYWMAPSVFSRSLYGLPGPPRYLRTSRASPGGYLGSRARLRGPRPEVAETNAVSRHLSLDAGETLDRTHLISRFVAGELLPPSRWHLSPSLYQLPCLSRSSSRPSYSGSLVPSTSMLSITGGEASRFGACAMRAVAIGPLRCFWRPASS